MPDFDGFWTWKAWFGIAVVEIEWVEVPGILRMEDGVWVDASRVSSHGQAEIWKRSAIGRIHVLAVACDFYRDGTLLLLLFPG